MPGKKPSADMKKQGKVKIGIDSLHDTGTTNQGRFSPALISSSLLAILTTLSSAAVFINLADEGIAAMGAWRIAEGQVPYRDFFEIIPPISLYPSALLVWLGGPSVWALRLPSMLLGLGLLWATYMALKEFGQDRILQATALCFLGPWGVSIWPCPSHHWYATLFHILALISMLKALSGVKPMFFAGLSGVFTALDVLSLQDQGGYFLMGLLFIFFPLIKDAGIRKRTLAGWIVGGAAIGLVVLVPLVVSAGFSNLWYQWFTWPMEQYGKMPSHNPGFRGILTDVLRFTASTRSDPFNGSLEVARTMLVDLLLPLSCFSLAAAWYRGWLERERLALLCAGVLAAIGGLYHRPATLNIHWIAPVLLIPCLLAVGNLLKSSRGKVRVLGYSVLCVYCALPALFSLSILFQTFSGKNVFPLRAPAGTLYSIGIGEGGTTPEADLISAIKVSIPDGEPFFTRSFIPYINFLTWHRNPSSFNFIIHPLYHTDAQAKQAIEEIEKRGVRYIVSTTSFTGKSILDDYLQANYEPLWRNQQYIILARKRTPGFQGAAGGT